MMTNPRTNHPGAALGRALAPSALILIALLVAACQGAPQATASPSDDTAEPPAAEACLDADVVAAIDDLEAGNLDTDPALADVADALDGLDLEGDAADARDTVVTALREDAPDETEIVSAVLNLRSQVALPEC